MKLKHLIFSTSFFLLTALEVNAQTRNINYEYICKSPQSYGFTEEYCVEWRSQNPKKIVNSRNSVSAQERVYKIRLRDAATGNTNQWSFFSPGDLDREEWVIVTVTGDRVKIRHASNVMNKIWWTRQWYDHPAIAIRVCTADQFDTTDCQTAKGDSITLPEGQSIHDVQIDFKFSEGGAVSTRSVQIPLDADFD
jgi:hypothetical protein